MKQETAKSELEILSDPASLERVREYVGSVCRELARPPLDDEQTYKVTVAVQEAVTNIMRHAYGGRTDGKIRFETEAEQSRMTINIWHEGTGLDPLTVKEPVFDGSREGGFGIYIISRCMDHVHYFSDGKGAHCVSLITILSGG